MKNILILNTVFLGHLISIFSFTASAQSHNKQEIEETIGWLNQYGLKFDMPSHNRDYLFSAYVEEGKLVIREVNIASNSDGDLRYSIDSLRSLECGFNLHRSVYDVGFSMAKYRENGFEQNNSYVTYNFLNKNDAIRVFNAFKHLLELLEYDFEAENKLVDENKF